ncbi:MAG: HAMP domain-containing histidine kinase [Firmicutes bacterium]|nr:HAMP domain-containing histidine kinase [Bacillota bacterium]
MIISRKEVEQLSADVRRIVDGHALDLRDNLEGRLSILKNDIHTLACRLNNQAASLQEDKTRLADTLADISHQLKTPLTAMMVMVDLLEDAPPQKQTEFTANIRQGLTQTGWLVNSLLKMAKLESGTVAFNPVATSVKDLIGLAVSPLKIMLDIKNQQVEIMGNIEIFCDLNWTAEALTNVIKNALEHSPEGSTVRISVGENPICKFISVTDAGEGIPSTKIKSLFRRFGGDGQGTGIGLPLAKAIMRGQGGDIEVDAGGKGKGAAFTLKFFPELPPAIRG